METTTTLTHREREDVAARALGFIPEMRFVKVTSAGTISWTAGKPQEILALLQACEKHGYQPARELIRAGKRIRR